MCIKVNTTQKLMNQKGMDHILYVKHLKTIVVMHRICIIHIFDELNHTWL